MTVWIYKRPHLIHVQPIVLNSHKVLVPPWIFSTQSLGIMLPFKNKMTSTNLARSLDVKIYDIIKIVFLIYPIRKSDMIP